MWPTKRLLWPPDPASLRKIGRNLAISLVFILLLELVTSYLKAEWIAGTLRAATASMTYAGRSLAVGTAVEMVRTRLTEDRYHLSVRNLRAVQPVRRLPHGARCAIWPRRAL